MEAGKLDQRIELQAVTETNSHGAATQAWTSLGFVWGYVLSQHGSESFEAARTSARQTIRVKIRFRDDVQQTSRLIWEDQAYNIVYVDRSLRRKGELWLTAELSGAT